MPTSRRLQLAAEAGGGLGILLVRPEALAQPSAARTRWRIAAAPGVSQHSYDIGLPAWRLELVKAIGGQPAKWNLVWDDDKQAVLSRRTEPERTGQGQHATE
jgi:protein ImuA